MADKNLEYIVQNFVDIMPLFQKKLIRRDCGFEKDIFNHSQFQIMATLNQYGKQPISEVAKKLLISTPNMTKLLNKLIDEGMVERFPDDKDRRIININLTEKGKNYLNEKFNQMKLSLKNRLSTIPNEQLDKLSTSLENLKNVLTEISSDD